MKKGITIVLWPDPVAPWVMALLWPLLGSCWESCPRLIKGRKEGVQPVVGWALHPWDGTTKVKMKILVHYLTETSQIFSLAPSGLPQRYPTEATVMWPVWGVDGRPGEAGRGRQDWGPETVSQQTNSQGPGLHGPQHLILYLTVKVFHENCDVWGIKSGILHLLPG